MAGTSNARPNMPIGILLPFGWQADDQHITKLENELAREIVNQIQDDRCLYWHEAAEKGSFRRQLLGWINYWASSGFSIERFPLDRQIVSSYSSIGDKLGNTRSKPSAGAGAVMYSLSHICGYYGNREFQRVTNRLPWAKGTVAEISLISTLGGPPTLLILCEALWRLLDMVYLAVHGDYGYVLADWLLDIDKSIRGFAQPTPEFFDAAERTHSKQQQALLLSDLWRISASPYWSKNWLDAKKDIAKWIAGKPVTAEGGPSWPETAGKKGSSGYLVNNEFIQDYLSKLSNITGGAINDASQKRTVKVVMTGGAYRHGGRKPPSVSHGTTYGVDLDLVGSWKGEFDSPPAKTKVGAVEWTKRLLSKGVVAEKPPLGNQRPKPVNTLFGLPQYEAVVMFTQSILLTLPSRLYYGDIVVLSAALGGLSEVLIAEDMQLVLSVSYSFDPVIHFNHWHIDWLPDKMEEEPCPNEALLFLELQKQCSKGKHAQKEVPPISKNGWRRQFVRPVYFGSDKTPRGKLDDVDRLILSLGDTVPLRGPIGDVNKLEKVTEWIKKYGLSRPGQKVWSQHNDSDEAH